MNALQKVQFRTSLNGNKDTVMATSSDLSSRLEAVERENKNLLRAVDALTVQVASLCSLLGTSSKQPVVNGSKNVSSPSVATVSEKLKPAGYNHHCLDIPTRHSPSFCLLLLQSHVGS